MIVDRETVRDDSNYGLLDVTGVLQKSSNVGASKMTLSLPPESLYDLLKKTGFGEVTDSGFPGASAGFLPLRAIQNRFDLATLSFGYGIAVTNLQLAHAYTILADGGVKYPVSLLRENTKPNGVRIMSSKVAHEVLTMLESVVEKGGTATRAQVSGYRVSGKTGTVRIVGPHGYEPNHHTAIFVGVAPVSNPQLVISVIVKNPERGGYFGGLVSAPVFSMVMGAALRILDIPPDKPGMLQEDLVQKYLDAGAKLNTMTSTDKLGLYSTGQQHGKNKSE
jgi:cell division protein FtsI (penicillin-binding protein 3)